MANGSISSGTDLSSLFIKLFGLMDSNLLEISVIKREGQFPVCYNGYVIEYCV